MNTYLSQSAQPVTISPKRALGPLTMHCVVEEGHSDDLEITEHPVEQGATINDHAYKKPAEVTLRGGWSNSSKEAGGNEGYVREMYAKLLELQEKREPFDLVTGKRAYKNMLIQSLAVTTDQTSETILLITATLKQVNIVQTQATTMPPRKVQKNPAKTGGTTDKGTKQPEVISGLGAGSGKDTSGLHKKGV